MMNLSSVRGDRRVNVKREIQLVVFIFTSGFAKSAATLPAFRCPLNAATQTSRVPILTARQGALSQSGELRGEVYPAEEVGSDVVELHFDIVLLLDRSLVVVDGGLGSTDDDVARLHARYVLVGFDGTVGQVGTVATEEGQHGRSLEFVRLHKIKRAVPALRQLASARLWTRVEFRSFRRSQDFL